jgi:raffinose/stachyose/melibiose transport system permease protein
MVQARSKRHLYFLAFVVPALVLYGLFFIYPFGRGLAISFTNWDGLTPRSPISMPKAEFESSILGKVKSEADKKYLLSVYSLDASDGSYHRLSVRGATRNHVERIMARAGYQPDHYRGVGFQNYADIFNGKVDARFYPRTYTKTNYKDSSDLPAQIAAADVSKTLFPKLNAEEKAVLDEVYALDGTTYKLKPQADEFTMEDSIWSLPEVKDASAVDSSAVDALIAAVQDAGLSDNKAGRDAALTEFLSQAKFSDSSRDAANKATASIFNLGEAKRILSTKWVEKKLDLGVTGFTLFFAVLSVLFSNLLAFLIALALDTKIRTKNVLRSVFFLPNVLSMIVVALIWSILFSRLLPYVTGIDLWMGDPDKAPWLVVSVAVWQMAGYYMIIYLAGLQNVPTDVVEAAKIDGASGFQVLRFITLPLLVPAITICLFLSTANALKCFDLVYALVGPSGYALGTVPFVMDIYFDAFANKLVGLATAKATLLFLVILIVTGLQLVIMKRKEVQA